MHGHANETDDFEIIQGGLIYRLFTHLGLIATDLPSAWRSVIVYILIGWLPLFVLAFIHRRATGIMPQFSLYADLLVYARLLVVIFAFYFATSYTNPSIALALRQFKCTGLIRQDDMPRYTDIIAQARRWRDSTVAEVVIILLAFLGAYVGLRNEWHGQTSTWITIAAGARQRLTMAGWWYLLVTIPLYQMVLYRWIWRLCIWYRILWRISRMPLQLQPVHPDMMGGLGFILIGHVGFGFLIFAISVIAAASVGNRFLFQHIQLPAYLTLFVSITTILVVIFVVPLLMFTPKLLGAKRQGLLDYGLLAANYARAFAAKWENGTAPARDQLLGNPDFQSLADLANGFNIVRKMRLIPFDTNTLLFFAVLALLPIIPLLFTVKTRQEIVNSIVRILLP